MSVEDDGHWEVWRQNMVRQARIICDLAIVVELAGIIVMIRTGSWLATPGLFAAIGALVWARWLMSKSGQRWIKVLRGEGS